MTQKSDHLKTPLKIHVVAVLVCQMLGEPKHIHPQCKIKLDHRLTAVHAAVSSSDTLQSRLVARTPPHPPLPSGRPLNHFESEEANLLHSYSHFSLKDMMTYTWPGELALSSVALKTHLAPSQTELGFADARRQKSTR